MHWTRSFLLGAVAGLVAAGVIWVVGLFGLNVDIPYIIGSLFFHPPSRGIGSLGLSLFVIGGGFLGWLYAATFHYAAHHGDWKLGARYAVAQMLVLGLLLWLVPAFPPGFGRPGPFLINWGVLPVVAFVLVNLAFGATLGGLYAAAERGEATAA